MKKYIINFKTIAFVAIVALSTGCNEEFLDRPSEDNYTLDNFYSTDAQVRASAYPLYGKLWAPFVTKWYVGLGELPSGNCQAGADATELVTFSLTSSSSALYDPWLTCYSVIAQSNNLINNLRDNSGPAVSESVLQTVIAEAHFSRALAYFYLVRLFGNVPIIENNLAYVENPMINTNPVDDVYTLIKRDFQFAADHLPARVRGSNYGENVWVSKGTAQSLLAKVHLYRKEYAEAVALSNEVIASGEFKLYGGTEMPEKTFGDLFLIKNNNNEESIFSWQFLVNGYFYSNYNNIQYGLDALNEATYGATYYPTIDIQDAFEPGDKRRKETYMIANDYYPGLASDQGPNFLLDPALYNLGATGAFVKKYVVGKQSDATGPQDNQGSGQSLYIMRYADLLLINAEAIMGTNSSTSDAKALSSFNQVRNRAGLPSVTVLTHKDIIHERRVEFAFEGEYWYDLCRIPRAEAIELISQQNRGQWQNDLYVTPTEADFIFPIPTQETTQNPKLLDPPVPYTFN